MNPGFPGITALEKPRRIDMMETVPSSFASCFSTKTEIRREKRERETVNKMHTSTLSSFPGLLVFPLKKSVLKRGKQRVTADKRDLE